MTFRVGQKIVSALLFLIFIFSPSFAEDENAAVLLKQTVDRSWFSMEATIVPGKTCLLVKLESPRQRFVWLDIPPAVKLEGQRLIAPGCREDSAYKISIIVLDLDDPHLVPGVLADPK